MNVGSIWLIINLPTWWGFEYLQNGSEISLCVSVDGETEPCPKAALDCLFLPGLASPPFPNNCLNLPIGTQGKSWGWMKVVSYNQRNRVPERPCAQKPHGACTVSLSTKHEDTIQPSSLSIYNKDHLYLVSNNMSYLSIWDLTRITFNIHSSTNGLFIICVFSKMTVTFFAVLLFSSWTLTRIAFNVTFLLTAPSRQSRLFAMDLKTYLAFT